MGQQIVFGSKKEGIFQSKQANANIHRRSEKVRRSKNLIKPTVFQTSKGNLVGVHSLSKRKK